MKKTISIILASLILLASIPVISVSASQNVCKIGNTEYATLASALEAAQSATEDVTVTLIADTTIGAVTVKNTNGKKVIIDGANHTLTTANDNNALMIQSNALIKNMKVVHNNWGSFAQIYAGNSTVDIENVELDASALVKRNYTLINTIGNTSVAGEKFNLNLFNVNVKMAADVTKSNGGLSVIRTGNGGDSVNITAENCNIDVSGTNDGYGILVMDGTTAEIKLKNTYINTRANYPIMAKDQKVEIWGGDLTSVTLDYHNSPISGNKNVTDHGAYTDYYIYGSQETAAYNDNGKSKFDLRFIVALETEALEIYRDIRFRITAAYKNTVHFSKDVTVGKVYESLSASDKVGNISKLSLSGKYLSAVTLNGVPADQNFVFTVEYYGVTAESECLFDTETFTYSNGEFVDSDRDTVDHSINRADLSARYILVSDIHYVMAERSGQSNRVKYRGLTNDERMTLMCDNIRAEYYARGLDAIFVLGDLSTDDYYPGIESKPQTGYSGNACKAVYDKFLKPLGDELGVDVFVIGGNHDSYSNAVWKDFSGRDRQYVVDKGDNVFLMCDVYDYGTNNHANKDGNYANGNNYTGVNLTWLEQQLELYKDRKNVFVASHFIQTNLSYWGGYTTFANLIAKYDNVVSVFDAHTHHYKQPVVSGTSIPMVNTGNFAYGGFNGDFNANCSSCNSLKCLWGFQVLEVSSNDDVLSYSIYVDHYYTFTNRTPIDQSYEKFGELKLK